MSYTTDIETKQDVVINIVTDQLFTTIFPFGDPEVLDPASMSVQLIEMQVVAMLVSEGNMDYGIVQKRFVKGGSNIYQITEPVRETTGQLIGLDLQLSPTFGKVYVQLYNQEEKEIKAQIRIKFITVDGIKDLGI